MNDNTECPEITYERVNEYDKEEDDPIRSKFRNLNDIYNSTNEIHIVCLLTGAEDKEFKVVSIISRIKEDDWNERNKTLSLWGSFVR